MPSPSPTVRERLSPADVAAVERVVADASDVDAVPALSDHVLLHLRHGGDEEALNLLLHAEAGELVGYAHLDVTDPVEGPSAELVVHPSARGRGLGRRLAQAVVDEAQRAAPGRPVRLWSHGDGPAAAALAEAAGFRRWRVLHQMRRPLGDGAPALPDAPLPNGVTVRTFVVGEDEERWTEVNNRAFADHPDQGGWSLDEVRHREAESWFDPAGFFLAVRGDQGGTADAERLVGFHWTKVHGGGSHGHAHEPLGEVYVVGVDPDEQGTGLGKALTVLGLRHLAEQGLEQAMLYVDESNEPAVRLYERLGFSRHSTDVCYRRG